MPSDLTYITELARYIREFIQGNSGIDLEGDSESRKRINAIERSRATQILGYLSEIEMRAESLQRNLEVMNTRHEKLKENCRHDFNFNRSLYATCSYCGKVS